MLLRCEKVSKRYEGPTGGTDLQVLNEVNLEVGAGDSVSIRGPSGSGKSTLLNIIGTLDDASSGRVLVEGDDIAGFDAKRRSEFRAAQVGFVFQLHHLLPQCSVLENVLVPTLSDGAQSKRKDAPGRARELLQKVGLEERIGHVPGELSGGERLRVAVARSLINQPKLLLADEPTGSLDEKNASQLVDLLLDLNRDEGVTLIMVTHASELANRLSRVLRLHEGKLVDA